MKDHSIDEDSFCKICHNVIKLSTLTELEDLEPEYFGEYITEDKKNFLLGRIMGFW